MIKIPNAIRTSFLTKFKATGYLEEKLDSVPTGDNTKTVTIKVSFLEEVLEDTSEYDELRIRATQIDPSKYDETENPEYVGRDEMVHLVFRLVDGNRKALSSHYNLESSLSAKKEVSQTMFDDFVARYEAEDQALDKMNEILPDDDVNTKAIFVPKSELDDFMSDASNAADNAGVTFDHILIELAQVDTEILNSTDQEMIDWVSNNEAYTPRLIDDRLTVIYSALDSNKDKIAETSYYDVGHLCPPGNCK